MGYIASKTGDVFQYSITRLFSNESAVKLIGKMVQIFMYYGIAGMLVQTNPALCCATPLGLNMFGRWEPRVGARASRQPWALLWNAVGVQCPRRSLPARTDAANAKGIRTCATMWER
jgi:hypothetical protein